MNRVACLVLVLAAMMACSAAKKVPMQCCDTIIQKIAAWSDEPVCQHVRQGRYDNIYVTNDLSPIDYCVVIRVEQNGDFNFTFQPSPDSDLCPYSQHYTHHSDCDTAQYISMCDNEGREYLYYIGVNKFGCVAAYKCTNVSLPTDEYLTNPVGCISVLVPEDQESCPEDTECAVNEALCMLNDAGIEVDERFICPAHGPPPHSGEEDCPPPSDEDECPPPNSDDDECPPENDMGADDECPPEGDMDDDECPPEDDMDDDECPPEDDMDDDECPPEDDMDDDECPPEGDMDDDDSPSVDHGV